MYMDDSRDATGWDAPPPTWQQSPPGVFHFSVRDRPIYIIRKVEDRQETRWLDMYAWWFETSYSSFQCWEASPCKKHSLVYSVHLNYSKMHYTFSGDHVFAILVLVIELYVPLCFRQKSTVAVPVVSISAVSGNFEQMATWCTFASIFVCSRLSCLSESPPAIVVHWLDWWGPLNDVAQGRFTTCSCATLKKPWRCR